MEELKKNLAKVERHSGTWEHYEAVVQEMRHKYSFLLDHRENELEEEEGDMAQILLDYDRL